MSNQWPNDVYAGWHAGIYVQSNVHVCADNIVGAVLNPVVCENSVGVY